MKEIELKEYSNISEMDVSKIPQSVINDIANIIYAAMCRQSAESEQAHNEISA